jgi:hypothetical protein
LPALQHEQIEHIEDYNLGVAESLNKVESQLAVLVQRTYLALDYSSCTASQSVLVEFNKLRCEYRAAWNTDISW